MRKDARQSIEQLSGNDTWLFEHMITAFWHTFGIANGLDIKPEDVEEIDYTKGPKGYRVKKEIMREKLDEYLRWLETYKEKWGSDLYNDVGERERSGIYDSYYASRAAITCMIELLQV
jgi:hypothetical protein